MTFDDWWNSLRTYERPFGSAYEFLARKAWDAALAQPPEVTPQRPCPTCGCRLYKEMGPCAGDKAP